jgi:hypothetical protein
MNYYSARASLRTTLHEGQEMARVRFVSQEVCKNANFVVEKGA